MIKKKLLKICILILMLVFCLLVSGLAYAGDCAGKGSGIGTPTIPGNANDDNMHPPLQYDPANPQTIDRNNTIAISVIGGAPPYSWSVSGTGFDLEEYQTTELSNILFADDTACGSADITITDASGNTAKGSVRCTAGKWVKQDITGMTEEEACPIPGPATEEPGGPLDAGRTRIEGKYKVSAAILAYGYCDEWGHPERDCRCEVRGCGSSCNTYNGTWGRCNTVMGCSKCLDGGWDGDWNCQAEADETISGTKPPCCEHYRIPSETRYMRCYCYSSFALYIWECN